MLSFAVCLYATQLVYRTNIYHIFNFPDNFRVLLLGRGGLWVFYGYGKGGCLLGGRVLGGGGAEMQFPLSGGA